MAPTPLRLASFRALTFDCYGTLIDWEAGIIRALRGVLTARGIERADDELLGLFAEIESPIQAGPFRRYREVLDETMRRMARSLGFEASNAEAEALSRSLPTWPPFPDTIGALQRLRRRFKLGIISNVDDDLFQGSARQLDTEFDWVVTAEQVRSYKPARNNFFRALDRIALPWDQILHVAQSRYHDIAPARSLGLATVWVNRRGHRPGSGATMPADVEPDLEVPDLRTLADLALAD